MSERGASHRVDYLLLPRRPRFGRPALPRRLLRLRGGPWARAGRDTDCGRAVRRSSVEQGANGYPRLSPAESGTIYPPSRINVAIRCPSFFRAFVHGSQLRREPQDGKIENPGKLRRQIDTPTGPETERLLGSPVQRAAAFEGLGAAVDCDSGPTAALLPLLRCRFATFRPVFGRCLKAEFPQTEVE